MTNPWVQSARLRTLPLALSSVLLGTSISNLHGPVHWDLFALVVFISVGLQILSNYANDYGDFLKGTDTQAGRKDRMLAANKISPQQMKQVLIGLSGSILGLGIFTLMYAYRTYAISSYSIGVLLVFGLLAIAAAVMYTVGKKAYGYSGFGDVSVILFFGIVPVVGIGVLMGVGPQTSLWLGGIGIGLLSAAVLNINNYRDLNSDKKSGKRTLAVSIGPKATLQYQRFLLILGFAGLFGSLAYDLYKLLKFGSSTYSIEMLLLFGVFSPSAVFLSRYYSEMRALKPGERDALNLQLKRVSLTILILCVIHFGLSFYVTSLFR
jgi:1,4-dihydroxy-2-naphthoate octaprenyltransferase